jgi:hypothetical protein
MERILQIGQDIDLLTTRAAVLASEKIDVVSCVPFQLAARPDDEKFDLIILCHSLGEDARDSSKSTARRRWPGVRMLQVLKHSYEMSRVESGTDAVTVFDPETLIDNVMKLLGKPSSKPHGFNPRRTPSLRTPN